MKPQVVVSAFKSMVDELCEKCEKADSLEKLNSIADSFDGARKTIVWIMVFAGRPELDDMLYPVLADMREAFKNAKQAAYERITKA